MASVTTVVKLFEILVFKRAIVNTTERSFVRTLIAVTIRGVPGLALRDREQNISKEHTMYVRTGTIATLLVAAASVAFAGQQPTAKAARPDPAVLEQDRAMIAADRAQLKADRAARNRAAVQQDRAKLQQDIQKLLADGGGRKRRAKR